MATVSTHGKVKKYTESQNKLICKVQPPNYKWKGNTVRTSGSKASICNIQTMIFDVTVDEATADKLVEDYVFLLEYDDRQQPGLKEHERLVTNFAGYVIANAASAALPGAPPGLIASPSPSSLPPPNSSSSVPPQ
jgi:hypothetical protein